MLIVRKRYNIFLIVMLLLSTAFMALPVRTEGASHTLTVLIQEISRY